MIGARSGHLEVVQFLCDTRADISGRDIDYWTILMLTAEKGKLKNAGLLHDIGADLLTVVKTMRRP